MSEDKLDGKIISSMVGFDHFVRNNPRTDKFEVKRFHHIEFWCLVRSINALG